jgi:hypothetical protein
MTDVIRGDVFWLNQVAALRSSLAGQSAEFVASASVEEIEAVAGGEFAKQGVLAKASIVEVMRRTAPATFS